MPQKANKKVSITTPKHQLRVDCYFDFASIDNIKTKKDLFLNMCKDGCKNFNSKYCCPPHSKSLSSHVGTDETLLVLLFKLDLAQLSKSKYSEYHKLRIGNAILKPRIEKVMRSLEGNFAKKFLSTGACRLCKPCQKQSKKPCRHPDKMRFSL